jgi:SAM-dependent methyltransferase
MTGAYDTAQQVEVYKAASGLEPAEAAILDRLRPLLGGKRVLDLGVGAGRTTPFFLGLVAEYVGLDFAESMVRVCQGRFGPQHPVARFVEGDARLLDAYFSASSFDLVLFSFNGIDHLNHDDRMATLRQVHRVLRPGGWFCFSSHNAERHDLERRRPPVAWTVNPLKLARRVSRRLTASLAWRWQNRRTDFARLRREGRGVLREQLMAPGRGPFATMYYVSRDEARHQLEQTGFGQVEVFHEDSGRPAGANVSRNRWLYYLCVKT